MTINIPSGTWQIDGSHSEIGFSVRHLMISKVKGKFNKFDGTAEVGSANDPTSGALNVTIDASSISTNDENRDAHLRSADFFDSENYPTLTFVSTSIEQKSEDVLLVHGNMTIKDVTRPETFTVEIGGVTTDPYGNTKGAAEAVLKINRTDYGLTWNNALETGGVLVGEEVTITADIQAQLV